MDRKKIILDIIMTILFVSLMNLSFTGIMFHEIIGILIFILFVVHKLFNIRWIKSVSKKLFDNNLPTKQKVMYWLNLSILLSVTMITISGILISQFLFPNLNSYNISTWSNIHHSFAWFSLFLIVVHVSLHMKLLKVYAKNIDKTITVTSLLSVIGMTSLYYINIIRNSDEAYSYNSNYIDTSNDESSTTSVTDDSSDTTTDDSGSTTVTDDSSSSSSDTTITDDSDNTESNTTVTDDSSSNPTLQEYLSSQTCPGCHRSCSLSNIGCGRGTSYVEEATATYNETYTS